MIHYYDMDSRAVYREAYCNLARGGVDNLANSHCPTKLPIGNDRRRTQRITCKHCSNIGVHDGTK